MKELKRWTEGNTEFILKEISPGHTVLGKYQVENALRIKKEGKKGKKKEVE